MTSQLEPPNLRTVVPPTSQKAKIKLVAFGLTPTGYISIGIVPMGVIAIGIVPMGVITLGTVAMGAIASGLVSMGIMAFGLETMSLVNLGRWQLGGLEIEAQPHNHQLNQDLSSPQPTDDLHQHH